MTGTTQPLQGGTEREMGKGLRNLARDYPIVPLILLLILLIAILIFTPQPALWLPEQIR